MAAASQGLLAPTVFALVVLLWLLVRAFAVLALLSCLQVGDGTVLGTLFVNVDSVACVHADV